MEPKVIELLMKRVMTAQKETAVLYELNEAEMIILTHILMNLPIGGISPKLAGKLLRATAHLLESMDEIAEAAAKEMKK